MSQGYLGAPDAYRLALSRAISIWLRWGQIEIASMALFLIVVIMGAIFDIPLYVLIVSALPVPFSIWRSGIAMRRVFRLFDGIRDGSQG